MSKTQKFVSIGITGVALAVLITLLNTLWIGLGHGLVRFVLSSQIFFVSAIVLVAAGLVVLLLDYKRRKDKYRKVEEDRTWGRSYEPTFADVAGDHVFLIGGLIAGIVLAAIAGGIFQSFLNHKSLYEASSVGIEKDADTLSYSERVPFDVASSVSSRSLGDTSGNAVGNVKSFPKTGDYSTAVIRRGWVQGYESVQTLSLPTYGAFNFNDSVKFCDFSENAGKRLGGGWFSNNLYYPALHKVGSLTSKIDDADVRFVCDGDTPKVYLPVTKLHVSFLSSYEVPAGVVIYNGKTGELTYEADFKSDDIPAYPISVAAAQRDSITASNGFWDYVFGRAGYETTAKDKDDVNSSNPTEFALLDKGGKTSYVTPLTPRGSSSSVIGVSTVPTEESTTGSLAPLTIHTYETSRQAPSTIASTIISTELSGYKANGLTVFEVVPSGDGSWTASIGKEQSILYRANIDASGKVRLFDSNGNDISGQSDDGSGSENKDIGSSTAKPLDQMSVGELKNLADEITGELADRANASDQGK